MRAKKIPAKHIVTVRPDGSHHVWADFYLERYGWIPVDVNARLVDPRGIISAIAGGWHHHVGRHLP
ncbi:transglutaminase-like domain-containing protein [Parabacteroides distasonis]|nr:transglutaminase-like domain-containing protein [Parabacteroides distasonis]